MSSPDLTTAEREAVAKVLDTPNLSMGDRITAFEKAVREYTKAQHAIGVSSGTGGLHLCVRAAGVQDGDLVITTPFSFVASSNVILFERAVPIFIDVDVRTGNIDAELVKTAVKDLAYGGTAAEGWLPRKGVNSNAQVKAILPVDVFGQPADMDPIVAAAHAYELAVIEDSCEALGAAYKGRQAGTLGHYGVYAFYPNKQITTGEGGMIVTDDDRGADLMRSLRNQGRAPGDTWLQHTHLGYNYRMNEMSAALGEMQMSRIDELLARRDRVAKWYEERLTELLAVQTMQIADETSRMSWFVYVVRLAPEIDRDRVVHALKSQGVPARPYFSPIHLQPYMVARFDYQEGDFPITEDLGRRSLALPFSSVMPEEDVERVCQTIAKIL